MKIEHLISTMYRTDVDFLYSMNCKTDVLIVNQTDEESCKEYINNNLKVRMFSTKERGLSNSRNMLLHNACAEISIIGDDDLIYADGYCEMIKSAYKKYPDADIIVFRFSESKTEDTRKKFSKPRKLNLFNISKVASVEVTFKTKSILKSGINFCPLLGLGAEFGSGEENAFLADALRAGLVIRYVPQTICYLQPTPPERMKWKKGFNKEYFIKRGACFYRIYGKLFLPFSVAFLGLKKRNIFKKVSILKAFKWMLEGKKKYIQISEKTICS